MILENNSAQVLSLLYGGEADCIITDPPYKLTSGGGVPKYEGATRMGGCFNPEKYINDGNLVKCDITWDTIMDCCFSLLTPSAHAYIMTNDRNMEEALASAKRIGFKFHNLLIWNKGTVTPNRWYMHKAEYCLFLFKGRAFPIANMGMNNIFNVPNAEKFTGHPTQKPVALISQWVENSTVEGQTVCDPFMGSGSTAIACLATGRNFMGSEIDKHWFDVACKRIASYKEENNIYEDII